MAKYATKVIDQAKAWIGKNEKDGSHKVIIDTYNAHKPLARGYKVKYTDSWCATFVSAVAIKVGYTSIIPTECSCPQMIELFKKKGCWVENENRTPSVGDIIFYDWQDNGSGDNRGASDHVGIVEKISGKNITVIEGNKNDAVERRTIAVNGKFIRGYGVPKYDKEVKAQKKTVTEIAKEVILNKWGTGTIRKAKLTAAGYNYNEVQAKVNELMKKVDAATVKVGSKVKVKKGAKSYEGKTVDSFIYNNTYVVDELKGDRAVLDKKGICTAFKKNDLTVQ